MSQSIRKMKRKAAAAMFALLLSCPPLPSALQADVGLSSRFVDVTLEGLQIGVAYNIRELKKVPYTVKNLSGAAMRIRVEVVAPKLSETAKGYEPIPDPTWVRIVPDRFTLEPGRTGYGEIIIQVPNDPKYDKRHYHVKLWAKTDDNPYLYAAGIISNLKFSTGLGPETLRKNKIAEMMMTLDFDVTPQALYIEGVEPGVPFDFRKMKARPLKITNRSDTQLRMELVSVPWDGRFNLGDYKEAPNPDWLVFKSTFIAVEPDTIEPVYPVIQIPKGEEHYGKMYAFLVKTELVLGVELEYFNRIYVKVKEKDGGKEAAPNQKEEQKHEDQ